MYIATFMFTPTLPLFARGIGAVDPAVGGFIILVYTIGSLVPRVIWGNLADSWERKPVYLIGALIMTLAAPFFGLFVGMALGPDLGLEILQQLGPCWLFGAGVLAGSISLGIGMLLNYEKERRLSQSGSYPTHETIRDADVSARPGKVSSTRGMLFEKSVLITCLVLLFTVMPYGAIMGYIASYGIDRGVDDIGLYFSVFALSLFVVRLLVGRLSNHHGVTMVIIPGIVLMIVGLVVLNWAANLAVFMLSAVLFGLGFGVVFPLLQAIAYMLCPVDRRGVASATLFSTADLAYGVGAVVLGLGIKYLGYAAAFAGLAIFVVIALLFYMILLYPRLKS